MFTAKAPQGSGSLTILNNPLFVSCIIVAMIAITYIILDEPTAALDPIAEAEVYSKFNEIVGDKTAVYISHRLSSCRFCDDIIVFHNAHIVQQGNHDELVANKKGKYHELWYAQAQYYAKTNQ